MHELMASDLRGVMREEKGRGHLVRRKRPKATGRNCNLSGRKLLFKHSKEARLYSQTYMILRESVIRNSPLPMRCACKLDCYHPIVDSKKSEKPLCLCLIGWFSFIHSSPTRGFPFKSRQTLEPQP